MKRTIASAAALAAAVIGTGTVNSIANADTIETNAKNETTVKNDVKTSKQAESESEKVNAALNSAQQDFNETQAKNDADKADLNKAESEKNQAATAVKDAQEKYEQQKRNEASADQIASAKGDVENASKELDDAQSKADSAKKDQADKENAKDQAQKEQDQAKSDKDKAQAKADQAQANKDQAQKENDALNKGQLNDKKDELNAEISAKKDEQTKAETALDKADQAKNDADKQKEDAVSENKTAQDKLNDAQQKYDAAKKDFDAAGQNQQNAQSKADSASQAYKDALAKLEGLTTENLNKELVKAKAELESAQKDYEETLSEYKTLVSEKGQADSKAKEAKQKADAAKAAFEKIQAEYAAKKKAYDAAVEERKQAQNKLDSLNKGTLKINVDDWKKAVNGWKTEDELQKMSAAEKAAYQKALSEFQKKFYTQFDKDNPNPYTNNYQIYYYSDGRIEYKIVNDSSKKFSSLQDVTQDDYDELMIYALNLINDARRQWGIKTDMISMRVDMNAAKDIAQSYSDENWSIWNGKGHYVKAITKAAYKYWLDDYGENWGSGLSFYQDGKNVNVINIYKNRPEYGYFTMDMLKGNIYGDIMGMMFGDAGSAWGHLYNFIDETKRSVGLGIDSMGASHFFIHTDYSNETPDVTPIKGLEMVSVQASNTALSEAQQDLARAKAKADQAKRELDAAAAKLSSAQTENSAAQTDYSNAVAKHRPQRMPHSRRHKAGLMQAARNCPLQKRKIPRLKENLTI